MRHSTRQSILIFAMWLVVLPCSTAMAQSDLVIDGENGTTYEGGIYQRLVIADSTNVTIRNASFSYSDHGDIVNIRSSTGVVLENNDIDGLGVACTGIDVRGGSSDIWIRGNVIHGIGDDGMEIKNISDVHVIGNTIYGLFSDSDNCSNGHSDGIEIFDLDDSEFIDNLIFDVRGTSAFFFGDYSSTSSTFCNDIVLRNNVFFTPESGFAMYIYESDGTRLYNNTIWNGRYGGVVIGRDVTNLDVTNNILSTLNYNHTGESYDPTEHSYQNNLLGTTRYQATPSAILDVDGNFVLADPRFATIPEADDDETMETDWRQVEGEAPVLRFDDFVLKSGSSAQDVGDISYALGSDALGVPIPQGPGPDLGALETPIAVSEPSTALAHGAALVLLACLRRYTRRPLGPCPG